MEVKKVVAQLLTKKQALVACFFPAFIFGPEGSRTPDSSMPWMYVTTIPRALSLVTSGRWESNPVYLLPKQAYYRYTTARTILF